MPNQLVRITLTLRDNFKATEESRRAKYVMNVLVLHRAVKDKALGIDEVDYFSKNFGDDNPAILQRGHVLKQDKKNFSWMVLLKLLEGDENPVFAAKNARRQYIHYASLVVMADQMVVHAQKDEKSQVSDVVAQVEGVCGMLGAVILSVGSIIYKFGATLSCNDAHYYGTLNFLGDMVKDFFHSLAKTLAAVIFPVSMVSSKYYTGSWNIFKGARARARDSLRQLCQDGRQQEAALVPTT